MKGHEVQRGISRLRTRGGGQSPSGSFPIAPAPPSAPSYHLVSFPTQAGRGGSVSRRDHNPAAGNRAQLAGGIQLEQPRTSNPNCSSGEGLYCFQRRQVAAALSAAVTIIQQQETAPNSQGEPSWSNREPRTPAALREGARGRGFSQRSRLPRSTPVLLSLTATLREGARGRGFS